MLLPYVRRISEPVRQIRSSALRCGFLATICCEFRPFNWGIVITHDGWSTITTSIWFSLKEVRNLLRKYGDSPNPPTRIICLQVARLVQGNSQPGIVLSTHFNGPAVYQSYDAIENLAQNNVEYTFNFDSREWNFALDDVSCTVIVSAPAKVKDIGFLRSIKYPLRLKMFS